MSISVTLQERLKYLLQKRFGNTSEKVTLRKFQGRLGVNACSNVLYSGSVAHNDLGMFPWVKTRTDTVKLGPKNYGRYETSGAYSP